MLLCAASKLQTIGSLRPSLIEYVRDADRLPATLADVQVNATYPCLYSRCVFHQFDSVFIHRL